MMLASDGGLVTGSACTQPDLANKPGVMDRLGLSKLINSASFSESRMARPWSLATM